MSYAQIAENMQVPISNVRTWLHRAQRSLEVMLSPLMRDEPARKKGKSPA
jgi:DNA-directed RNA polymerase specialized sigma24 family protein